MEVAQLARLHAGQLEVVVDLLAADPDQAPAPWPVGRPGHLGGELAPEVTRPWLVGSDLGPAPGSYGRSGDLDRPGYRSGMGTVVVFDYVAGIVRAGASGADKVEVERAIEQQRETVATASGRPPASAG